MNISIYIVHGNDLASFDNFLNLGTSVVSNIISDLECGDFLIHKNIITYFLFFFIISKIHKKHNLRKVYSIRLRIY